ncbi:MAG: hypothetical protein ACLTOM_12800 [Roseburia sp.]
MQKQYGYLMRRGYKSEDILRVVKCPDCMTPAVRKDVKFIYLLFMTDE